MWVFFSKCRYVRSLIIHLVDSRNFKLNPYFQSNGGAKRKVRGSLKSLGFILWGPGECLYKMNHGNLSNSCRGISVCTKVVDQLTQREKRASSCTVTNPPKKFGCSCKNSLSTQHGHPATSSCFDIFSHPSLFCQNRLSLSEWVFAFNSWIDSSVCPGNYCFSLTHWLALCS